MRTYIHIQSNLLPILAYVVVLAAHAVVGVVLVYGRVVVVVVVGAGVELVLVVVCCVAVCQAVHVQMLTAQMLAQMSALVLLVQCTLPLSPLVHPVHALYEFIGVKSFNHNLIAPQGQRCPRHDTQANREYLSVTWFGWNPRWQTTMRVHTCTNL